MKFFVYYLQALLTIEPQSYDVYRYLSKVLTVTTKPIDGIIPQNLKCKEFALDVTSPPERVYVTYSVSDVGTYIGAISVHSISLTGIGYVDSTYITEPFELNANLFDIRLK